MLDRRTAIKAAAISGATALMFPKRPIAQPASRSLFQQPVITTTIDRVFSVTSGTPAYNPDGVWYCHANQPNPFRSDHNFVPVTWNAGAMTGYQVSGNPADYQRGIVRPGATAPGTCVQVQGGVVAAYLDSADLIHGSPGHKMMISPQFRYLPDAIVVPFANATSSLAVSMDLQVPFAADGGVQNVSSTYISLILLLVDPVRGTRIAYQCNAFTNGSNPQKDGTNYDAVTNSLIVGAFIASFAHYLTPLPGSALFQSAPWRGWKTFSFTIAAAQVALGIHDAAAAHGAHGVSTNPADYVLAALHLNAEMRFRTNLPAQMGWSMQNLVVVGQG